jgi:chloramphenicol-sensitive protein RarD
MVDRRGLLYGIAAYLMWGFFPLYFPLLKPAGATEILAQRIIWSLVAVAAMLAVQRNWAWIKDLTRRPKAVLLLALAGTVVTINWGTFIYGVNTGHTLDASLGYFINPLLSVVAGVLIFRERLRPWQWFAIGLGSLAVVVLTVDEGRPPWIALILAFSFGAYGLIKKSVNMPSAESLAVETFVLTIPAFTYALYLQLQGSATVADHGPWHLILLAGTGVITAAPLMLFNAAAIRLPLSTIGMIQYLTPVLQFIVGLAILHEAMPASRWIGFLLVWGALLILTVDGLRTARSNRLAAAVPEQVPQSV